MRGTEESHGSPEVKSSQRGFRISTEEGPRGKSDGSEAGACLKTALAEEAVST